VLIDVYGRYHDLLSYYEGQSELTVFNIFIICTDIIIIIITFIVIIILRVRKGCMYIRCHIQGSSFNNRSFQCTMLAYHHLSTLQQKYLRPFLQYISYSDHIRLSITGVFEQYNMYAPYGLDRCRFQCTLLIYYSLVYNYTCCPFILPALVVIHSIHDRTLSCIL